MKKYVYIIIAITVLSSCQAGQERMFIYLDGFTQGTSYLIAYNSPDSTCYHDEIKELFRQIDYSMSIYNPQSVISAINRNDADIRPDEYFLTVFNRAALISEKTGGAFDITVGPLVNAWGFGFTEGENITPQLIDSLLNLVGWQKVRYEDGMIVKDHPGVVLDMNAIAKGYTVDVVAEFLDSRGITDYMIEVGGEIRVKGTNRNNQLWRIGIDKPVEDPAAVSRELQEILHLTGVSLATSGNYRRFYVEDGQRYAHTIDPHTGYPARHSLLSATVVTSTSMDADAYATAFMVMGLEESMDFASSHPDIEAYFIYDLDGVFAVAYTDGIAGMMRR
ncbi:MAG: FAD:protein FMN transferase [Marinilabiliales bacterium]|nr:MAG: FAD:protein FMN transferase [Marinilabiliales bacterium]